MRHDGRPLQRLQEYAERAYHGTCRSVSRAAMDRALRVDTAQKLDRRTLGFEGSDRGHYEAASWQDLRRVLRPDEVSPSDVFLDIGSGKGRVVLLAARYRFGKVIGVELSESLTAIARRNVATCRLRLRCPDVEVVAADALAYGIPDDVSVVYMYNPFHGALFDGVVAQLIASVDQHPRVLRLIYRNPRYHDRLMATGRFRVVRVSRPWRPGREWRAATAIRVYDLRPAATAGVTGTGGAPRPPAA